jgi:hypothetical protein
VAKHIWLVRHYQRETIATAMVAYNTARAVGYLDVPEACRFVGYTMECLRQSGSGAITHLWNSVAKSGHRYSRGKNAGNYELAGRRILAQRLRLACTGLNGESMLGALIRAFEEEGEWQPLYDYLQERDNLWNYEQLVQVLKNGLPPPPQR